MNNLKSLTSKILRYVSNGYTTVALSATLGILGFLTLGPLAFAVIPLVIGVCAGALTALIGDKILRVALKKKMENLWIRIFSGFGILCAVTLVFSMEFPAFILGSLFSGAVYFLSVYLNAAQQELIQESQAT